VCGTWEYGLASRILECLDGPLAFEKAGHPIEYIGAEVSPAISLSPFDGVCFAVIMPRSRALASKAGKQSHRSISARRDLHPHEPQCHLASEVECSTKLSLGESLFQFSRRLVFTTCLAAKTDMLSISRHPSCLFPSTIISPENKASIYRCSCLRAIQTTCADTIILHLIAAGSSAENIAHLPRDPSLCAPFVVSARNEKLWGACLPLLTTFNINLPAYCGERE
jgi:hypothetical protein